MRRPFWRRLSRRTAPETLPGSKTYLYVSDAKVNMLTEGLSKPLRDQFDLTVEAGVPGVGSVGVASRHSDWGRFERAERLCAALDAQGRVGAVTDEESEFIRGTTLAVWGFWNRRNEGYADVVLFTSFVDEKTLLGLGGSAYHTMERDESRLQKRSNSGLQALMTFLKEQSELSTDGSRGWWKPPDAWDYEVGDADHDNVLIPEEIEYVAVRLLDWSENGFRRIVGSPIYVARTGNPVTKQMLSRYAEVRDLYSLTHHGRRRLETSLDGRWEVGKLSAPVLAPLNDPSPRRRRED